MGQDSEIEPRDIFRALAYGGCAVAISVLNAKFILAARAGDAWGLPPEAQRTIAAQIPEVVFGAGMILSVIAAFLGMLMAGFGFWLSLHYAVERAAEDPEGDADVE